MKKFQGESYLTIGEVARLIKRTPQTIKSWYNWIEDNGSSGRSLPTRYNELDVKKTNYFLENDIPALIQFRDSITYGVMAEYNVKRWGKRGENSVRKEDMQWSQKEDIYTQTLSK